MLEKLLWGIDEDVLRGAKSKNSVTPTATLCNINLKLTSLEFNPVLWGQKPDPKSLSHSTAEEDV